MATKAQPRPQSVTQEQEALLKMYGVLHPDLCTRLSGYLTARWREEGAEGGVNWNDLLVAGEMQEAKRIVRMVEGGNIRTLHPDEQRYLAASITRGYPSVSELLQIASHDARRYSLLVPALIIAVARSDATTALLGLVAHLRHWHRNHGQDICRAIIGSPLADSATKEHCRLVLQGLGPKTATTTTASPVNQPSGQRGR